MKLCLTVVAVAALAGPVGASAATLTVTPQKPCYGTGDSVTFHGTGFTPGAGVDFTRNGRVIDADDPIVASATGEVAAELSVAKRNGRKLRRYAAVDRTNPANRASVSLTVSELNVDVVPSSGTPARWRRITAVGFTGGKTLWAHVRHAGRVRNVRLGRLRGACAELSVRRRLFGRRAAIGRHVVRFDTQRAYRRKPPAQAYRWVFLIG